VLRLLTAGESHGRALVAVIEDFPPGYRSLWTRSLASLPAAGSASGEGPASASRPTRSPFSVASAMDGHWVAGRDRDRECRVAQVGGGDVPEPGHPSRRLTQPRPGHADLAGMQKYGFDDARDVLERASARETAARVAAGSCAKALLAQIGVAILSHVVQIGGADTPRGFAPCQASFRRWTRRRCGAWIHRPRRP